jgi:hypothetical protein
MALLRLPSELIGHILIDVGSEFFYQDTRRLTVSRRWYGLALPILTRDLEFASVTSLEEFFTSKNAVAQAETHLRSVRLDLDIFYDELVCRRLEPYKDYDTLQAQWRNDINDRLASLAAALQRCPRLGTLSVIAPLGIGGLVTLTLAPEPFVGLLSAGNLTSLVLDISGDHSIKAREGDEPHLCRHINALLPSLRRLRCRMFRICGSILRPLPDECPPKLNEVIINLTREHCAVGKPGGFPKHCRATRVGELFTATKTIQTRATELAGRLRNPRMVRVIAFEPGSHRSYAFDALTGRRTWLNLRAGWDAGGEEMAEDEMVKVEVRDLHPDDSEDEGPA